MPVNNQYGVIVGRFQNYFLHDGHKALIEYVSGVHMESNTIIFIGVARGNPTDRNPLDFESRKSLILESYPGITVLPLRDQKSDIQWSEILDNLLDTITLGHATLYGGRDNFFKNYHGKYPTIEIEGSDLSPFGSRSLDWINNQSASNYRNEVADQFNDNPDQRLGAIKSVMQRYPVVYPTVDVIVRNSDNRILLGKKKNESQWRMIGGFVDPKDQSLADAAKREFREETGGDVEISNPVFFDSRKVDDWRYKGTKDGIMTTVFVANYLLVLQRLLMTLTNWNGSMSTTLGQCAIMMKLLTNIKQFWDHMLSNFQQLSGCKEI
jgi:bifunctional NMN adenylyltransferase/nudix hydrolase